MGAQTDVSRKKQLQRVVCTRWNSKQAAVTTTLHCYSSVIHALALELMASAGADHATVSQARGLAVRLKDIRFITTLFVLKEIFAVAGPASRQFQGICTDLAMAAQLVLDCRDKFAEMRSDNTLSCLTATWKRIVGDAKTFASQHSIEQTEIVERRKCKPLMAGEGARDE